MQPLNESGTIQCITTPCELPSPQPVSPISDNNSTVPLIPKNITQPPESPPNDPEPCISPCSPGEICIQMCKPIGQIENSVTESGSSSKEQERPQDESTLTVDKSSENTGSTIERHDSISINNEDGNQALAAEILGSSE
jgi:hypothetical protein